MPCLKWKCICFGRCNIVQYLNTPESYLGNAPNPSTMYFTPTGPDEVITIIQSFKTKKSTGDDGISMHILKQLCQSCSPITNLINLSLEQGIVPDAMTLAKVIPIYKAKSRDSFSNKAIRDVTYLALPHASAWHRSPHSNRKFWYFVIFQLARVFIFLIDRATQEVPMKNIWKEIVGPVFLRYTPLNC